MKRFAYWRDPLCVAACALYWLNRCVVKPHASGAFWQYYLNDGLLIPAALPLLLWMQRALRLRAHDLAPSATEVALYWTIWSVLFEVVGPHLIARAKGDFWDFWDVIAYGIGGLVAWAWWNRHAGARLKSAL